MATPKGQKRTSPEDRRYDYIQSIRGRRNAGAQREDDLNELGYSTGEIIGKSLRKRQAASRRKKAAGQTPRYGV